MSVMARETLLIKYDEPRHIWAILVRRTLFALGYLLGVLPLVQDSCDILRCLF